MQTLKEHIVFKIVSLSLVAILLVPTVLKFAHIFAHHEHDICLGEKSTHLHELNIDCDLHKFKLSNSYAITFFNFSLFSPKEVPLKIASQYQFLSEYQRLQTSLRGPPYLI
ncbi:hypothetical protein [Thalassobellus suaedae]|uniref:Uncharacterized protein n=1 Tax=Thalassobellus suaedae TaxID=3074124 RepID=A0ABY9XUY3_9FLAO|nr:hypothetical protein RHP51_03070 [Flavobacteriaceae bacterium HL-DH14]WNH11726.1 hypothetical protein RHP49_12540 [Flavobacteriaceae bacterium HL-DH10]